MTDGVVEIGDLIDGVRHLRDAPRVERQPVEERVAGASRATAFDVLGVRGEEFRDPGAEPDGDRAERRVLGRPVARRDLPGGCASTTTEGDDFGHGDTDG